MTEQTQKNRRNWWLVRGQIRPAFQASLALTRPVSAPPQDPPFCRRPAVYIYSYERANESRRVVETEGVVFTSLSNCIMHADAPLQFDLGNGLWGGEGARFIPSRARVSCAHPQEQLAVKGLRVSFREETTLKIVCPGKPRTGPLPGVKAELRDRNQSFKWRLKTLPFILIGKT